MMDTELLTMITRAGLLFSVMFCIGNVLYTEIRGEGYTMSKVISGAIRRRKHANPKTGKRFFCYFDATENGFVERRIEIGANRHAGK